jgi:hypothetical protein
MSSQIISQLQPLKKKSGIRINPVAVSHIQSNDPPSALIRPYQIANMKWAVKPLNGASSLSKKENCSIRRKVRVLSPYQVNKIAVLNDALLGGRSYPILTAALGIVGGAVSAGAGLIFTVATTAISYSTTAQRILARAGDEIWHVEEIGREGDKPVYVSAYFIQDPYRAGTPQAPAKGWLIHEERKEVYLG